MEIEKKLNLILHHGSFPQSEIFFFWSPSGKVYKNINFVSHFCPKEIRFTGWTQFAIKGDLEIKDLTNCSALGS